MARKKKEDLDTEVEESPPEAILDEQQPKRLNELDGLRATKKIKTLIRALDNSLPFLDFTAFVKEYSDKAIYSRLAAYFDEACRLLSTSSLGVTVESKLFQIKPEHGLETRGMTGIADVKHDRGGRMSDPFPDGVEFLLYSNDRKKVCVVKAFIRHGLIVTWFNQTLTVR
jgi:hypothetical protein